MRLIHLHDTGDRPGIGHYVPTSSVVMLEIRHHDDAVVTLRDGSRLLADLTATSCELLRDSLPLLFGGAADGEVVTLECHEIELQRPVASVE